MRVLDVYKRQDQGYLIKKQLFSFPEKAFIGVVKRFSFRYLFLLVQVQGSQHFQEFCAVSVGEKFPVSLSLIHI